MLFSEPKIPQIAGSHRNAPRTVSFSALQRAENSSKVRRRQARRPTLPFQCSSASRKFLKDAERVISPSAMLFQCSSASRKFLKAGGIQIIIEDVAFQCSSASRKFLKVPGFHTMSFLAIVSVLFSEPKIPQTVEPREETARIEVSVLFSEPKIPQNAERKSRSPSSPRFSALQRAENSSMDAERRRGAQQQEFQCSSASRKFLNAQRLRQAACGRRFSALQRAENSSRSNR